MRLLRLAITTVWTALRVTLRRLFSGARYPGWSWRLETLAAVLQKIIARQGGGSVAQLRCAIPEAPLPLALRDRVQVARDTLGGVPVEVMTPEGWTQSAPTVLYLHGGGYAVCSPGTHRWLVGWLAHRSGARCWSLDYRLAPEHPFPAALEDSVAAYRALLEEGQASTRLVIAGDSAGGGLSLATMIRLRDEGTPLPAAAVLLSPWVDLELRGESIDAHAEFDYLSRDLLLYYRAHYLQGGDPQMPLASPLHADLKGLPPLLIQVGGAESFLSEDQELAQLARNAQVEVCLDVAPGMIHVWQAYSMLLPEGVTAIGRIAEFVRLHGGEGAGTK